MKVLVANRGEIAVRVIRALKEMDLGSAAVYSEEDKDSPHRALADESWCIGPAPAKESYLHAGRIITAAKLAGAGAIHPGYGFLAENDAFAGACEKAGITFIGPKASVMKKLADKLATKNLLEESGVPVIPGGGEALSDVRQAALQAETAGYPVLLKAVFGGGGRGITLIRDAGELNHNFEIAKSESKAAFGKDLLYMEKFLDNARHIEVQTAADIDGHAVAFTERDCTIQRRNQKLLEESPSPFVGEATRQKLLAAASAAVQACGLTGLATVEFLLMPDRQTFYFMEINKRIQVEHPVTEELLGIDLVAMQISLALGSGPAPQPHSGGLGRLESHRDATSFGDGVGVRGPGRLPANGVRSSFVTCYNKLWPPFNFYQQVTNEDLTPLALSRHCIEVRINAEDPADNFMPGEGIITRCLMPGGPGIRTDSFIAPYLTIGTSYDSLIAKIIATSSNGRNGAIRRLQRALEETVIGGIATTIPFHRRLLAEPAFSEGKEWFSARFIETWTQKQKFN